jgi:asparagine synthase (glutamine-hydrolysing)
MCGIAGVAGADADRWIGAMVAAQIHRGPDDEGVFADEVAEVALGMRRLSILDIAGGAQPMANEARTRWIVFNGEIFNAPSLRRDLERAGRRFRTINSDTEVLLHLYDERGSDMLEVLNGMFAFVIYDVERGVLFGARDRIGIKPFYYCTAAGRFAFASELKALLTLPWIDRDVQMQSLFHYLSLLHVPGEPSIIRDVKRLLPAHTFTYDLKTRRMRTSCYWRLGDQIAPDQSVPATEWPARIRTEFGAAVRRWSLADVRVACSLSGGLDSSAIVALMRQNGAQDLSTYSIGFSDQHLNELPLARLVARKWETDHHELVLEARQLLIHLPAMVWHLDEPYGGGLPSWYVFQMMANDVKVAMTGTGGDELFGDYGKYRYLEMGLGGRLRILARHQQFQSAGWRSRHAMRFLAGSVRTCFHDAFYYFTDDAKRALLDGGEEAFEDTSAILSRLFDRRQPGGPRNATAALDMRTQLPDEFLAMTDRFSMAHSVEARVPFLDHQFVEFCLTIPPDVRTRDADYKYLLREAVADLLPRELLTAPKRGFVLPTSRWIRQELRPLVEFLLGPAHLRQQGIFRPDVFDRLVAPHLRGQCERPVQIWSLLMFQLWHWLYIERQVSSVPTFGCEAIAA